MRTLIIDLLITCGVLAFVVYGLKDSYKVLKEAERRGTKVH